MAGTSVSAGKICARLDYSSLSPVATGVSEVLQTSIGAVASCNVSQAGDYVVLQLSYRLKATAQGEYHNLPGSRGAWAPLLAKVSTDISTSEVWSRRLQLVAALLGVGFVLVFVCVARFMFRKDMNAFDEEDLQSLGGFSSGFDWQDERRLLTSAFGSSFKGRPESGDSRHQKGPSASDLLDNGDEPDSPTSMHQDDSIGVPPRVKKGRKSRSSLVEYISSPAGILLRMVSMSSSKAIKKFSRQLSGVSSSSPSRKYDGTGAAPFAEKGISDMDRLLEMDACCGRDSDGRTALHIAASKGNLAAVRALLDREAGFADPRHVDYHGQTPVHVAAKEGHDDIMTDLVMYGGILASMRPPSAGSSGRRCPSLNQQDQVGNTPLHLAAGRGHIDVIRALECTAERNSLDLSIQNSKGWTPLQLAALNGHTEIVMELVKLKPSAAFPRTLPDLTPRDREPRGVAEMSSDERDVPSLTPLHIASKQGHVKLVRRLLEWMKEHEDGIDDDYGSEDGGISSDDPEDAKTFDSAFSQTRKLAAGSFRLLKSMASNSKKKLQTLIPFKRPMVDVLDRGFEMSRLSIDDDEVIGHPPASHDMRPLIQDGALCSAPKAEAIDDQKKKSSKTGVPRAARSRPRVAAHHQQGSRSEGSRSAASGRAGQQGGASSHSGSPGLKPPPSTPNAKGKAPTIISSTEQSSLAPYSDAVEPRTSPGPSTKAPSHQASPTKSKRPSIPLLPGPSHPRAPCSTPEPRAKRRATTVSSRPHDVPHDDILPRRPVSNGRKEDLPVWLQDDDDE